MWCFRSISGRGDGGAGGRHDGAVAGVVGALAPARGARARAPARLLPRAHALQAGAQHVSTYTTPGPRKH